MMIPLFYFGRKKTTSTSLSMTNLHLLVFLSLLFFTACAKSSGQGIVFDSEVYDFGNVKQGEKQEGEFVFRNTGKDTILLMPPKASCGCTAALLSESRIFPGMQGRISASFTPFRGMQGHVEKTIEIFQHLNGDPFPIKKLKIKANVVSDVITDRTMLEFRSAVGDTQKLTLRLKSNTTDTVSLKNISLAVLQYVDTSNGLAYNPDKVISKPLTDYDLKIPLEELKPGESTELQVTFKTEYPGQLNGHIRMAFPNSELRIPVVGVVLRNRSPGDSSSIEK